MAQNYTSITERGLAGGINKQAAEDSIPEGYVENAVNVNINSEGLIEKRPGFRTYLGHLPIRAAKVKWDHTKNTNNLTFELTSAEHSNVDVDLSNVASTAILVVGRSSIPVGEGEEFNSTYNYRYYTGFAANPRKTIPASSAGVLSYPQAEHGYTTKDLFIGLTYSDSQTNKNNSILWASSVAVNEATFDVEVGYDNDNSPDAFSVFTYALPLSGIVGTSYAAIHTTSVVGDVHTITIPALTHNLNSFNIMTRCYEGDGTGTITEIIPDEVFVNSTTGEVTIQFRKLGTQPAFDVRVLLHIPNVGNQYIDSIPGEEVTSITIPNIEGDFIFLDCFIKNPVSPEVYRRVIPTDIVVDTLNGTAAVTFDNTVDVSDEVVLIWDYATVKTTKFSVTAQTTLTSSGEDVEPELSIYGILAEELYPEGSATQPYNAWVQHIDTYKTEGNTTLVAGMGWNLFRGSLRNFASPYLALPILYPSLRSRAVNGTILAPAFHDVAQQVKRTRGAIRFSGGGEGWGQISSIVWDASESLYKVNISAPGHNIVGTPLDFFTAVQPFGDMLTIAGAELRSFDGDWPIWGLDSSEPDVITLKIKTTFTSSDYDCQAAGEAGIFTDQMQLSTSIPLLLSFGDQITAQSFPTGLQLGFIGYKDISSVRYTFVNGVSDEASLSTGQLVLASREQRVCYGLRTLEGSTTGFSQGSNLLLVKGDSLLVNTQDTPLEVKQVLSQNYTGLTLVVDEGVATLSGLVDARQFAVGQSVLISALGLYSGEFEVTAISSNNTEINLDCSGVPDITLTGVSIPPHFELREALSFSDDAFNRNIFAVEGRWECVEKPQIDTPNIELYSLIEPTVTEHLNALDYGAQAQLRSTMSQDNLYLTNSIDPIQKYDGVATYRAGLPRWNPQLFMTRSGTASGVSGFTEAGKVYSYYFRISAIDVHENVIISASTGIEDYKITADQDGEEVHIRLLGFPNWDDYDFEKLSVEIYRTKGSIAGEYFFLARIEMPQTPSGGYIDFVDVTDDFALEGQGIDLYEDIIVGSAVSSSNLNEPLRAKYMTTIDNRLVLANIRDWQRVDLRFSKLSGLIKARGDDANGQTDYDFYNKTLTIHNDSEDTATATDMHNRVTYEFKVKGQHYAIATSSYDDETKLFTCTLTTGNATSLNPPILPQVGDWVYLMNHHTNQTSDKYYLNGVGLWQIREVSGDDEEPIIAVYMPSFDEDKAHLNYACLATAGSGNVPVYIDTDDYSYMMSTKISTITPSEDGESVVVTTDFDIGNANNITMITRRLAAAVNMSMRQVDISIPGYENFKPWIMADAGGEFDAGTINFRRPKESVTFFSVTVPSFSAESNIKVATRNQYVTGRIVSLQRRFPSRVLLSYRNFPEVFNRSADLTINPQTTDLVPIDVNAADGQEITGIIPFFGESVSSGSQREEYLVAFKSNSIYLINISARSVQKIESNGLGCTAPASIAPTKDGIMFANESGIYKLTRSQTVEPIGQFVDRVWRDEVDLAQLTLAQGHHFGVGRQYKLSVPLQDANKNSDVLVYEHTRESRGQIGAWSRHDNHAVTGWCNLLEREFFATSQGRVCVTKDSGSRLDFSDRGESIEAAVTLRSNDFGVPNTRKRLLHVGVHFRNPQEGGLNIPQESTTVEMATDLSEDFLLCSNYTGSGLFGKNGLADSGLLKGETIRFTVPITKAIRFQPKIVNNGLYETLQFSGVTYRVTGLTTKGTKEAADSKT